MHSLVGHDLLRNAACLPTNEDRNVSAGWVSRRYSQPSALHCRPIGRRTGAGHEKHVVSKVRVDITKLNQYPD